MNLGKYELILCKNSNSYGLRQIKKKLINKVDKMQEKEVGELYASAKSKRVRLFYQRDTVKAFIVDYTSTKYNPALVPSLNTCMEETSAGNVLRIPIIMLISPFMDESRLKKYDNLFLLRAPVDSKSLKKMLMILRKYYLHGRKTSDDLHHYPGHEGTYSMSVNSPSILAAETERQYS